MFMGEWVLWLHVNKIPFTYITIIANQYITYGVHIIMLLFVHTLEKTNIFYLDDYKIQYIGNKIIISVNSDVVYNLSDELGII
jgi:hypothetical protein